MMDEGLGLPVFLVPYGAADKQVPVLAGGLENTGFLILKNLLSGRRLSSWQPGIRLL